MRVRGQTWIRKDNNYYLTRLHECYWSAYQRYGWSEGVPGIGISMEIVNKALRDNCGIVVNIEKYGVFRINPNKIKKYTNQNYVYPAADKKFLYVFPKTEFDKIEKSPYQKEIEEMKEIKRQQEIHQQALDFI